MLYTRQAALENVRNRDGRRVFYLGKGDQLTSDARDELRHQRIEILPADQARPRQWKTQDGGFLSEKPEDMTHLNGDTLVPKTHPRIAFRGAVDCLEAALLLCCLEVPKWETQLTEALRLVREILRCEVLETPLPAFTLDGLDAASLRRRSHFPQDYYNQPHFMPSTADGRAILQLNKLRCTVRQTELSAQRALPDRQDILQALNRLSSFIYLLMLREKQASLA